MTTYYVCYNFPSKVATIIQDLTEEPVNTTMIGSFTLDNSNSQLWTNLNSTIEAQVLALLQPLGINDLTGITINLGNWTKTPSYNFPAFTDQQKLQFMQLFLAVLETVPTFDPTDGGISVWNNDGIPTRSS